MTGPVGLVRSTPLRTMQALRSLYSLKQASLLVPDNMYFNLAAVVSIVRCAPCIVRLRESMSPVTETLSSE